MGLGKTIICLAVILASKEVSSKISGEVLGRLPIRKKTVSLLEMAASNIGQNGFPWRNQLKRIESDGSEYINILNALSGLAHYLLEPPAPQRASRNQAALIPRNIYLSTTTIVVVPSNLIIQWMKEFEKHTMKGSLILLLMDDGKQKLPAAEKLLKYDIILFSKPRFEYEARDERLSDEVTKGKRSKINVSQYQGDRYHSPRKDIHFKRLIIDEGHAFGNASRSSKSEAVTVVDFLNLSARWIISGTPTKGLYDSEVAPTKSSQSSAALIKKSKALGEPMQAGSETHGVFQPTCLQNGIGKPLNESQMANLYSPERKDLEKLGNIATSFLKVRSWVNSQEDNDSDSWALYVMQPGHGFKGRGNPD